MLATTTAAEEKAKTPEIPSRGTEATRPIPVRLTDKKTVETNPAPDAVQLMAVSFFWYLQLACNAQLRGSVLS